MRIGTLSVESAARPLNQSSQTGLGHCWKASIKCSAGYRECADIMVEQL